MNGNRRDLPEGVADLDAWRARKKATEQGSAPEERASVELSEGERGKLLATAKSVIDRYADPYALLDNYKKFPAQFSTEGLPTNASRMTLMEAALANHRRMAKLYSLRDLQAIMTRYETQEGDHPGVFYVAAAERVEQLLGGDFPQF